MMKIHMLEHPRVVISEMAGRVDIVNRKGKKRKQDFYITLEQASEFKYGEMIIFLKSSIVNYFIKELEGED